MFSNVAIPFEMVLKCIYIITHISIIIGVKAFQQTELKTFKSSGGTRPSNWSDPASPLLGFWPMAPSTVNCL